MAVEYALEVRRAEVADCFARPRVARARNDGAMVTGLTGQQAAVGRRMRQFRFDYQ